VLLYPWYGFATRTPSADDDALSSASPCWSSSFNGHQDHLCLLHANHPDLGSRLMQRMPSHATTARTPHAISDKVWRILASWGPHSPSASRTSWHLPNGDSSVQDICSGMCVGHVHVLYLSCPMCVRCLMSTRCCCGRGQWDASKSGRPVLHLRRAPLFQRAVLLDAR
jgi:hypothetical protein